MTDFIPAHNSINENGTTNNKEFFDFYKMHRVYCYVLHS